MEQFFNQLILNILFVREVEAPKETIDRAPSGCTALGKPHARRTCLPGIVGASTSLKGAAYRVRHTHSHSWNEDCSLCVLVPARRVPDLHGTTLFPARQCAGSTLRVPLQGLPETVLERFRAVDVG